jgi:hypothetical protein
MGARSARSTLEALEVQALAGKDARPRARLVRVAGGEQHAARRGQHVSPVVRMARKIVLEAVGNDLRLGQDARRGRKVAPEKVLDEREMRAAEDGAVRRLAGCLGHGAGDGGLDQALELGVRRALLDGTGQRRANLLDDGDLGQRFLISSA